MADLTKIMITRGVASLEFNSANLFLSILENYNKQPDFCDDGGDDKSFFAFKHAGVKMFAQENEVGGLTIMLPDEY